MKIHLIAIIRSKPAHIDEVKKQLQTMVVRTREEKACLQYDLHQDLEDPSQFIFYEIWQDESGLDLHNEQPYIQDFQLLAEKALQETPLIYKTKLI
ncbi:MULTISPECIES: putative quinol monooxygenase [Olivibacter]|jgi:quinol monooxygenase YgiN|uniref:Quinol monooxygenase n=1 Tax=Olivibacter oleidegradans TaxID=760123 RepID=A0ABV6HSH4_9SPHI|nr:MULTISPECIES: putative quinol monooxygenase [Olivibacter]QEL01263.1 antibiotic biosynthesis monooxygenase [Olivibacter sp. LS-1]